MFNIIKGGGCAMAGESVRKKEGLESLVGQAG